MIMGYVLSYTKRLKAIGDFVSWIPYRGFALGPHQRLPSPKCLHIL